MRLKMTALIAALAAACAMAIAPATAAPLAPHAPLQAELPRGDVIQVGHKKRRGGVTIGFHFRGGHVYFNGHRGYKYRKSGYKRHKGYYFPRRAFVVVVPRYHERYVYVPRYRKPQPVRPRIVRVNEAHYRWCDHRYRSYRISDDTFQPYHGPRKRCISPYSY